MVGKYYKDKFYNFHDFDLVVKDGALFAVYLKKSAWKVGKKHSSLPNIYGIAKSKNGINWEDAGIALRPDPKSWDQNMWGGSVFKENGNYVLYYTAVTSARIPSQKIGKAYSKNLQFWKKDKNNPVFVYDNENPYYTGANAFCFRDPYCFKHNGKKYIIFATKDRTQKKDERGCIGMVEEYAKNKFKWKAPIFSPSTKNKYPIMECPAIYKIKGMWYLLFGDDRSHTFCYAVSNSPFGPFKEPKNNILFSRLHYTAKIVYFRKKWLLYHWFRDKRNGFIRERLAPPKEVVIKNNKIVLKDLEKSFIDVKNR